MDPVSLDEPLPKFQRGLDLFNDNELPPSLRSSCLALIAEHEIRTNPPTLASNPSPNKKRLLEQGSHSHGLDAVSNAQKETVVGQLTQAYFESKHDLQSSFLVQNRTHELTIPASNHKSGVPAPTFDVVKHASRPSLKSVVAHNCPPIPRKSKVWSHCPPIQYERLGDALAFLGPTITQVKTDVDVESSLFL